MCFQCLAIFLWWRRRRHAIAHSSGQQALTLLTTVLVTGFSTLGALHSLLIAVASSAVPEIFVEYIYSLYEAALFGALGLLLRVWLEEYHASAWPEASSLREPRVKAARHGAWLMLAVASAIALLTDSLIAGDAVMFSRGVLAQHCCFLVVCLVAALAFWRVAGALLAPAGTDTAAANELKRMLVAWLLILLLWTVCLVFCTLCVLLNAVSDPSSPGPGMQYLAWVAHSSFVLVGGSAIAGLHYVLLHKPVLLDLGVLQRLATHVGMRRQRGGDSPQPPTATQSATA